MPKNNVTKYFDYGNDNPLMVQAGEHRGGVNFTVRHTWETPQGDIAPTKKGFTVPADQIPDLIANMQSVYDKGVADGLIVE